MRTRTHLTTPPDSEPTPVVDTRRDGERWAPALALPIEPRVPGPHRRVLLWLAGLALLAVAIVVWFQVATRGQDDDPSLTPPVEASEPAARS